MRKKRLRHLSNILTLLFLTTTLIVNGQTDNDCDTVYDMVETMPQYENDVRGLMDYMMEDLTPLLFECYKRDSLLTASIYMTLTIDKKGHVIHVEFNRVKATEQCKNELRQKIMTMTGWTPGKQDGIPVCSKYVWPISCINWK